MVTRIIPGILLITMLDNNDLQLLQEYGIIPSEDYLSSQIEEVTNKQLLKTHRFRIWQSETDGRWCTHLPDVNEKDHRRLIKKTKKEDLERAIIEYYKAHPSDPNLTVNDVFYLWIEGKRNNLKSQTVIRYENDFKKYIESTWFGKTEIKRVTLNLLEKFCSQTIGNDKMTAKCWSGIRTNLIGILKKAKLEGLTTLSAGALKDLDISNKAFKKQRVLPGSDVITNKEATILLSYIDNHDDDIELLGLKLLFKTGLRVGELAALRYSDFDFQKGVLTVTRTEERVANPDPNGKTRSIIQVREGTKGKDGWRQIIISKSAEELVNKIHDLNPSGDYLFEIEGRRIHANAWTKRLPRLCAKLGIGNRAVRVVNGKSVCQNYSLKKSTHKIRKNYCSTLLHAKIEPKFVQGQMGHSDLQTTLKYYDRETEEFEEKKSALLSILDKM